MLPGFLCVRARDAAVVEELSRFLQRRPGYLTLPRAAIGQMAST